MNTVALDHILRADVYVLDVFGGVYASDKLPVQVAKYPKAYVVNVDPSDRPGSHWVAFFSSSSEKAEFFYSHGQNPEIYPTSFVELFFNNGPLIIVHYITVAVFQCLWTILYLLFSISL